jgi:transposase-like protein
MVKQKSHQKMTKKVIRKQIMQRYSKEFKNEALKLSDEIGVKKTIKKSLVSTQSSNLAE